MGSSFSFHGTDESVLMALCGCSFPQNGLVLGVYKDGDKCVLTEEANKFNERVGGRLNELLCQYVSNLNRVRLFFV